QYHPRSAPAAPVPSTPANKAPTRHTGGAAPRKPSCSPPTAAVYCLRFGAQKLRSQSATPLPLAFTFPEHPLLSVLARIKKAKDAAEQVICEENEARESSQVCDIAAARLGSSASTIIIVDTNVVLHQIDLLENPAIDDVVVLSVVLEEVKNKNLSVYNRLRALCSNPQRRFFVFSNEYHKDTYVKIESGETPNDRNDRAIRVAARWYQNHLGSAVKVLLITNDRENKKKAIQDGIPAETVESYVKLLGQPALLDLIVQPSSEDVTMEDAEDLRPSKRKTIYPEHKPMSEITSGLHRGIYHQGKLRVNRYNPFEAYVGSESIGDEIVVYGRANMNRAFDGDIVAVELLPQDLWQEEKSLAIANDEEEEEDDVHLAPSSADDAPRVSNLPQAGDKDATPTRPSGRVIGIIKRNWHSYCGSLDPMPMPAGEGGIAHALFVSKDRRIPKIRIQTRQLGNLLDKRIIVAVDSWDRLSRYPSGHYVRTIGEIGDRDTESEVVLIENDIDARPFSSQVLACLPPLPWSVSAEDIANPIRQDLRHLRVFSVDPPGCKDIDDALHCTLLPSGNFEVGVHIADVTNFVHPGTPLDDEAAQRGTSVYLVERRIDMLPKPLTEDICSLRSDVERLTFSVIWEMTPEAEIISTRYTKAIIKSCAALSYVEAQARMDDSRLMDPLTTDLRNMNALAKIMRQKRIDRGALTLASAEVKFQIDTETHDPLDIGMYQIREANQMIEEFMLAANISVAKKVLEHFPFTSLLRRHPSPTKEMLEPLIQTAAAVGLCLDVTSSKALADSLDQAVVSFATLDLELLHITTVHLFMAFTVYLDLSPPEFFHYGLAAPVYTHFTSPIRRYADVIVHRLLAASLGICKLPDVFQDRSRLTGVADNLNYRHKNAQMASRASVELHTLIYFRKRPTDTEARILKIRSNGFIVFVPKYGIEGPIYLMPRGQKGGGEWIIDEQQQKIKKVNGKESYGVLQTVRIHMEVKEPQPNRPKLELTLI
ncbi:UNVERIFIED_CONTAM: Exosome complex exonuclease RRP44A, partial [Sesamum radiatum]